MTIPTHGRPIEVLMVEDSPDDAELALEALKDSKVANNIHVVVDGVEAMAFLRHEGRYAEVPVPDLILLDLNLPRKDGREVLAEIKADEALCHIPVVILTTSEAEEDILRTYKLHANAYITKPVDFAQLEQLVQSIENFWFSVVTLPTRRPKWGGADKAP